MATCVMLQDTVTYRSDKFINACTKWFVKRQVYMLGSLFCVGSDLTAPCKLLQTKKQHRSKHLER